MADQPFDYTDERVAGLVATMSTICNEERCMAGFHGADRLEVLNQASEEGDR